MIHIKHFLSSLKWSVGISVAFLMSVNVPVYAAPTLVDSVETTVTVSICGNSIVEGGEDCEGEDLDGQTCVTLGYASGILVCDAACDFDTSDCVPIPEVTPPSTTDDSDDDDDDDNGIGSSSAIDSLVNTLRQIFEIPQASLIFPIMYDPDADGKIDIDELSSTLEHWVSDWRSFLYVNARGVGFSKETNWECDLDKNQRCDLVDFSILLSYVRK